MATLFSLCYWFLLSKLKDSYNIDYDSYMKSDAWKLRRKIAILKSRFPFHLLKYSVCQSQKSNKCEKYPNRPDVHHITYKRFGREKVSDLMVVCRPCHRKIHSRYF